MAYLNPVWPRSKPVCAHLNARLPRFSHILRLHWHPLTAWLQLKILFLMKLSWVRLKAIPGVLSSGLSLQPQVVLFILYALWMILTSWYLRLKQPQHSKCLCLLWPSWPLPWSDLPALTYALILSRDSIINSAPSFFFEGRAFTLEHY